MLRPLLQLGLTAVLVTTSGTAHAQLSWDAFVTVITPDCMPPDWGVYRPIWPDDEPLGVIAGIASCHQVMNQPQCDPHQPTGVDRVWIYPHGSTDAVPGHFVETSVVCQGFPRMEFVPDAGTLPAGLYNFWAGAGLRGYLDVVHECAADAACPTCERCGAEGFCQPLVSEAPCEYDVDCVGGVPCVRSADDCRGECDGHTCATAADCGPCQTCPDGLCTGPDIACLTDDDCGIVLRCLTHDDPCQNRCLPPTSPRFAGGGPEPGPEPGAEPSEPSEPDAGPRVVTDSTGGCQAARGLPAGVLLVVLALAALAWWPRRRA